MRFACVTWMDAHFQEGDTKHDDLDHAPYVTHSVGILVKRDKVGVTLAQSGFEKDKGHCGETLFIPAGMIQKVEILKAVK